MHQRAGRGVDEPHAAISDLSKMCIAGAVVQTAWCSGKGRTRDESRLKSRWRGERRAGAGSGKRARATRGKIDRVRQQSEYEQPKAALSD